MQNFPHFTENKRCVSSDKKCWWMVLNDMGLVSPRAPLSGASLCCWCWHAHTLGPRGRLGTMLRQCPAPSGGFPHSAPDPTARFATDHNTETGPIKQSNNLANCNELQKKVFIAKRMALYSLQRYLPLGTSSKCWKTSLLIPLFTVPKRIRFRAKSGNYH